MTEASFASLGPTLLARKGGAKPAMRPQLRLRPDNMAAIAAHADKQLEDLGLNNMGADEGEASEKTLVNSTTPPPAIADDQDDEARGPHPVIDPFASAEIVPIGQHTSVVVPANEDSLDMTSPVALRRQKRSAQPILDDSVVEKTKAWTSLLQEKTTAETPQMVTKGKTRRKSAQNALRAAFTLRLDTDRHLKLRLAATMQGVSAQSLVTGALDALLEDIEDLDALVDRIKRN